MYRSSVCLPRATPVPPEKEKKVGCSSQKGELAHVNRGAFTSPKKTAGQASFELCAISGAFQRERPGALVALTRAEAPHMATEDRGFASMDPNRQREIASKGGRAAHKKGAAHQWTREEAQAAGRKGGLARHRKMSGQAADQAPNPSLTPGDSLVPVESLVPVDSPNPAGRLAPAHRLTPSDRL
jgi:general stress protein YciG